MTMGLPAASHPTAPATTQFHRLLVRERGADWRLVVTIGLLLLGLVLGGAVAILLVTAAARAAGDTGFRFDLTNGVGPLEMFATNLSLAVLVPISMLISLVLYRERPSWLASVRPGLRWGWLAACLWRAGVVWTPLFLLVLVSVLATQSGAVKDTAGSFVVVVLVTTPLQAAGEEFAFRGLLLQALGATRLPTVLCWLGSAALFATAHLQFSLPLFADRFLLGTVLAWLATRTGGLETGICIHTVKNLSVLIPAGLMGGVSRSLNPTGVSWAPFAVDVVLLSIVAAWVLYRYDRNTRPHTAPSRWPQP